MEKLVLEGLAQHGPLAIVFAIAVVALWKRLNEQDKLLLDCYRKMSGKFEDDPN